jgi:hypothetical protein
MLEMSIQQGSAGYFWAVMRVEEDGFFEPAGDRSLIYFNNYEACYADAAEWCDETGIVQVSPLRPRPVPSVTEMASQDAKLAKLLDLGVDDDEISVTIGDHTA